MDIQRGVPLPVGRTKRGHRADIEVVKCFGGSTVHKVKRAARRAGVKFSEVPIYPLSGLCAVCGRATKGDRQLHLDHDHVTGKPRLWCCQGCNTGMGMMDDNPYLLEKAALYLRACKGKKEVLK
jgi:Recombination endonuclease VII